MMRMRGAHKAKPTPGIRLENVPRSWLHDFINSLPPRDRLALFQTCTWLAKEVVLSSTALSLRLHPAPEWQLSNRLLRAWARQPEWKVYILSLVLGYLAQLVPGGPSFSNFVFAVTVSRLVLSAYVRFMQWWTPRRLRPLPGRIEGIINNHRNIHLTSRGDHEHAASLPLPCRLYSNVTALEVHDCRYAAFHTDFPLHAFSSLKALTLHSFLKDQDLRHFSAALEAGHLQHLRSLDLDCLVWPSAAVRTSFSQVAARMLGPSLTHLATSLPQMWDQLQHFTALQSVELGPAEPFYSKYVFDITPHVVRQLCQHPSLRSVTFKTCRMVESWADPRSMTCGFKTLVLDGTYPYVLAAISLADLQAIRFVGGLPECDIKDIQQLQRVLDTPGLELSCTSDSFFVLGELSAAAVTLITQFTNVQHLWLWNTQEFPPILLDSWAQLPESISSLTMSSVTETVLRDLWDHMPPSVSKVHLRYPEFQFEALVALLRAVPATVQTLTLIPLRESEAKKWARAKLHEVVPVHVKLQLQPPPLKNL